MGICVAGRAVWERAVEQGGVGHTAAAIARLEVVGRLARSADDDVLHSLALSTHASLVRQAGRHRAAAALDGRALLLAGVGRAGRGQWQRAATLDAMVGLAADNLGRYRFDAARRLLDRARTVADLEHPDDADWFGGRRPRLRTEWVAAELAMYSGDAPGARRHSDAALHLSRGEGAPERHRVKTLLIAAAADATVGDLRSARARAGEVTARARTAGLLPLEWASYALRQGLDPDDPDLGRQLSRTRTELIRRGVPFTDL